MKLKFYSKLTVMLGLSLTSLATFSAVTIYGLDQAGKFQTRSGGQYYIQTGSFDNKSNANRNQSSLQGKSHYPVSVKQKYNRYVVLVGPIKSSSEVRATAVNLGSKSAGLPGTRTKPVISASKKEFKRNIIQQAPQQHTTHTNMPAHAPMILSNNPVPPQGWFGGFGVGWTSPTGTDATNFATSGMAGFPDDKYVGNGGNDAVSWSILGGYQWQRDAQWFPALSLGVGYTRASPSINGVIYVNSMDEAKNFTYKYHVTQQLPMVTFKADLWRWKRFMPYVSVGAGMAINQVHNYSDAPIPGATLWKRGYGFTSTTNTQFANSIGAGVDYWIANKAQLSLGYQYTSSGTVHTGYGEGVLSSNQLSNKLNSNSVSLQAVYFLD